MRSFAHENVATCDPAMAVARYKFAGCERTENQRMLRGGSPLKRSLHCGGDSHAKCMQIKEQDGAAKCLRPSHYKCTDLCSTVSSGSITKRCTRGGSLDATNEKPAGFGRLTDRRLAISANTSASAMS
ncbi:hypothetical protein Bbelb_059400 [Branchiostoma belcheri]|nr:hypothetical protein Bbelb_059400 [Branchiostoma belcheri]